MLRRVDSNDVSFYHKFIESNCRIGQHFNCEVQVADSGIDPYHTKITFRHPHFYVENLSLAQGTYTKVNSRIPIANFLRAEMGAHVFEFTITLNYVLKI